MLFVICDKQREHNHKLEKLQKLQKLEKLEKLQKLQKPHKLHKHERRAQEKAAQSDRVMHVCV